MHGSYNTLQTFWRGKLLGTAFQKALRAFWDEARRGFGVHWSIYTNGHRSPCGLCDARKGIGVQECFRRIEYQNMSNGDAPAGIAKPARASVSISIDTPMNAEARAGFAPKGPTVWLLEACS